MSYQRLRGHDSSTKNRAGYSKKLLALAITSIALQMPYGFAQTTGSNSQADAGTGGLEEVIVTGSLRDTLRTSIETKRDASTIVDVISSTEIGSLPDLSVAETLERITGVTGDQFKGNASEISIRGLGPFLGYSTYNGREISSGSGNRSVAFSQFPSELISGATVYKSQSADLVEGGVAGLINLQSIRPLKYGKRRIQAEVKGNYNDYDAKLKGDNGMGYRGSVSYTDVFDTSIGAIGVAIGYSGRNTSDPEETYATSSTLRNCNSDYALDGGGSNCNWSADNAAAHGGPAADGDYFFIPNQAYFRNMESEETRDALMSTIQWQPNDDWDITMDLQWSDRFYYEDRHDLYLDDGRRKISDWTTSADHALLSYTGESRVSTYGEYRERDEEYKGGGLNVEWTPTDRLVLTADLSTSETTRYQETWQTRFRSDRLWFDWAASGSDDKWPSVTLFQDPTDKAGTLVDKSILDDYGFYGHDQRARYGEFKINDKISAVALNAVYDLNGTFFTSLEAGLRYSSHEHHNYDEDRTAYTDKNNADINTIKDSCATPYPQEGFGEDAGTPFTHWATYDTLCAYDLMLGNEDWSLNPEDPSAADINLTEDITALFAKANFDTTVGGLDVSGNAGVRVVQTSVESIGYRNDYSVTNNDAGTPNDDSDDTITITELADTLTKNVNNNDYINVLPSINVNVGLTDDVQLRGAVYKAISRPDMWWMGAGRELNLGDGEEEFSSVQQAVASGSVDALGNPNMEALESVNYDLSLSWYPGEDTLLSAALYYKTFKAQFDVAQGVQETFNINGSPETFDVNGLIDITNKSSEISGIELTAQHSFSWLPEPFDGLGVLAGANFADTNFKYQENGSNITDDITVTPGNLPGFSKQSYNAEVFWEKYGFSTRLSYKYRSSYLKPFGANFGQTNRYVADAGFVDMSIGYNINKNFKIQLQAKNLTNETNTESRVVHDSYTRIEYSGVKYYLGVRFKM